MKTYYPSYYKNFVCIADKCPITCCQEWKINIDDATYKHWCQVTPPADTPIQYPKLSDYTSTREEQRVITLDKQKKCPFLREDKLCRLVLAHGDGILSETCTMFPREYHDFASHQEATLMPGCPAVLNLWHAQPQITFPQPADFSSVSKDKELLFQVREYILQIIQCPDYTPELALMECFYLLSELATETLSPSLISDYFSPETLTQLTDTITAMDFSPEDMLYECNELLQDLAVNYQKEGLYQSFLTPLLNLATQISADSCQWDLCRKWQQFHIEWKKQEPLLRTFLSNEIFSDLLLPGGDPNSMQIHLQWIGMEYAAIRYAVFLAWLLSGREELHYKTVCDTIVILTRMTGYEDEDIYEYLENSFESLYWKWGYFAMILADV